MTPPPDRPPPVDPRSNLRQLQTRAQPASDLMVQTCRRVGIVSTVFGSIWAFRLTCIWLLLELAVGREYTRKSKQIESDTAPQ